MAFTCQICFEQRNERLALPKLTTGNGDVLRPDDCQHPICQECLATFVTTRVEEQYVFNIRCPFVGCTIELFEQDLNRLVHADALTKSISDRFAEIRARDYKTRAESLSETLVHEAEKNDFDSMKALWQTVRLCPRCSLAIQKSEGCNSFYCICGHHFDFTSAARVVGNGVKNFGCMIDVAKSLSLSLTEAEKYGNDTSGLDKPWSKLRAFTMHESVSRLAAKTCVSMDEAWELQKRAKGGDEEARARIRAAKQASSQADEEEHDEDMAFGLFWEEQDMAETYEVEQWASESVESAPDVDVGAQQKEEDVVEEGTSTATCKPAQEIEVNLLESLSRALLKSKTKAAHIAGAIVSGNASQ